MNRDNPHIERLNKILGNDPSVGWVPDIYTPGRREPQYKWAWTPTLTYHGIKDGEYQQFRLYDKDRWALVMWQRPIDPKEWAARYPELRYAEGGMWAVTDMVMDEGVEPTETITRALAHSIGQMRLATEWENRVLARNLHESNEQASRKQIHDLIDDTCLSYDAIPGKRGGMRSFGGFEESQQTKREESITQ